MPISLAAYRALTVLLATVGLAACGVNVHTDEQNGKADVDIQTPVGALSVHTDSVPPDTGLPVYPGAQPSHNRNGTPENADVNIASPLFGGVKVTAASFEHDDEPQAIVEFYKDKLKAYGDVMECHGNVDFKHRDGARRPVCKERSWTSEVQLVTGTEEQHRIVVVKPRGSGSEFSVVYVQTSVQD